MQQFCICILRYFQCAPKKSYITSIYSSTLKEPYGKSTARLFSVFIAKQDFSKSRYHLKDFIGPRIDVPPPRINGTVFPPEAFCPARYFLRAVLASTHTRVRADLLRGKCQRPRPPLIARSLSYTSGPLYRAAYTGRTTLVAEIEYPYSRRFFFIRSSFIYSSAGGPIELFLGISIQ